MTTRVQTQYQGRGEELQIITPETVQPIRARMASGGAGFELAKALGAIDTQAISQQVSHIGEAKAQEERKAAETYANGLTVDELGQRVKEGAVLPSQSPAFVAALQHIYGENTQSTFERDTLSKLQTGELKFSAPEEMDKYLTEHRNEALTGASKYTVAGYDKAYNQFRDKAISANTQLLNQQAVEHGVQEASDNLTTVFSQVTQPGYKGDAAQALVDRFKLLSASSLLRDDARKEALSGLAAQIATTGNQALLQGLLDKKLDSGLSIRSALGDTKAVSLLQHAEAMDDKNQRQRVDVEVRPFLDKADRGELDGKEFEQWATKNERWVSTGTLHSITSANQAAQERALRALDKARMVAAAERSESQARQLVGTAIHGGNLAFLPQQKVVSPTGEVKDFDTKKAAQEILQADVERMKMPLGKATEYWATNNVENPEWQREIQAGASNVASVGWSYDGKNIGQLNPQGQKAIETFIRINTTHPAYAEKLVGSGKDYKTLSDIQFLMEKGGFPNVSDAAALVNQSNRSGIEKGDGGPMTKAIHSAVNDVVNPGFWSAKVSWIGGMFGNDQVNLTSVQAVIRRRAELLVMSGQVPDAAAAVKATVEYLSNPAVTTKINNTLYLNKDLPAVPKGEEPGPLLERFIKAVPGHLATAQQMGGDVRLEPNAYGGFTAWIGGRPLIDQRGQVQVYQKEQISQWIDGALKGDRMQRVADRNYDLWKSRMESEWITVTGPDALPGRGQAVYNGMTSRESYEKFLKDGHAGKPAKELVELFNKRSYGK
jgi:hypothetical protein